MFEPCNKKHHFLTDYDGQIHDIIPYYDLFHKETINIVRLIKSNPTIWLDTGCGTGSLVEKAIQIFPRTEFFLSDPSIEMLNRAKEKLLNYSDRTFFLKPSNTQNLPLDLMKNLDVITAIQSHHYLSKKERIEATTKCYDLLKIGGMYITFENIRPFTEIGIEISKENWMNFQLSQGRSFKAIHNNIERFDVEYFPITIEEHLSILGNCGFKVVELLWYSCMQAGLYCIK